MDVFDAIRTTRSMRRLDPNRPVSDEDLWTILEAASKAPSGGNRQPVRWVVARDAEVRRRLGEIYRACWAEVGARYRQAVPPDESPWIEQYAYKVTDGFQGSAAASRTFEAGVDLDSAWVTSGTP